MVSAETKALMLFFYRYEVKFQNGIDCGGAYIKLLSKTDKFDLVSTKPFNHFHPDLSETSSGQFQSKSWTSPLQKKRVMLSGTYFLFISPSLPATQIVWYFYLSVWHITDICTCKMFFLVVFFLEIFVF